MKTEYILLINRLSLNKKIVTDITEAERIENNENNEWEIETIEMSRKACIDYYNEYYS